MSINSRSSAHPSDDENESRPGEKQVFPRSDPFTLERSTAFSIAQGPGRSVSNLREVTSSISNERVYRHAIGPPLTFTHVFSGMGDYTKDPTSILENSSAPFKDFLLKAGGSENLYINLWHPEFRSAALDPGNSLGPTNIFFTTVDRVVGTQTTK